MRMGSPSLKTTYEFQATRREPSQASASNFLLAIRRLGIAFRDAAGVLGTLGQRHIPSSPFDVGLPLIRKAVSSPYRIVELDSNCLRSLPETGQAPGMHICKIKLEAVDERGATFTRMDYEAFGKRRDHACRGGGDIPMIQQLLQRPSVKSPVCSCVWITLPAAS